jgi:hypothetical protein
LPCTAQGALGRPTTSGFRVLTTCGRRT